MNLRELPVLLPALVSYGERLSEPSRLSVRTTGEVLADIATGRWSTSVQRVRSMPFDSPQQKCAKAALPYCTWSGTFGHRAALSLKRHSGQIPIDLDQLTPESSTRALQDAVADEYCLAAYRSARGGGVRLLFRIPPCHADEHRLVFSHVAEHVRRTYGVEPDLSGADVCRASFVSFDGGLWANPSALVLPVRLTEAERRKLHSDTTVYRLGPATGLLSPWSSLGQLHAGAAVKEDGYAYTHKSLLKVVKAVALTSERMKVKLTAGDVQEAFDGWRREYERQGLKFRCGLADYRNEMTKMLATVRSRSWFRRSADIWSRWTRHRSFPSKSSPQDKLLFAIRQHCRERREDTFFLGCRDAALVIDGSPMNACRVLHKLVAAGRIERVPGTPLPRHAQEFRLLSRRRNPSTQTELPHQ